MACRLHRAALTTYMHACWIACARGSQAVFDWACSRSSQHACAVKSMQPYLSRPLALQDPQSVPEKNVRWTAHLGSIRLNVDICGRAGGGRRGCRLGRGDRPGLRGLPEGRGLPVAAGRLRRRRSGYKGRWRRLHWHSIFCTYFP